MKTNPILLPLFAMVALTFVVWVRLYLVRVREMRARRIHPQSVASSRERASQLDDTRASDNFVNLFEVPILFYLFCVLLLVLQIDNAWFLYGAWLFVVLRIAHSAIQCSYNKVMHRFKVYFASSVVLIALWVGLVVRVLGS